MRQKMRGDIIINDHPESHYKTLFSRDTGFFARIEDDGYPEPFWSEEGPELLDVAITNYCEHGCTFCYRQSDRDGNHMPFGDICTVVEQAKNAGVLQIALGGGNPNQHPQFVEILKLIREAGIVPSYTSNGEGLTDEILIATQKYCGAMALSLYPPFDAYELLTNKIKEYKIRLNLHVILKKDTIELLTEWLQNPPFWFRNLNALIVLNYKPIASSTSFMVTDSDKLKAFYLAVSNCKCVKVGFDSCCVPGIVSWMDVNPTLIESCESARFSAFISEDMKMYPCSFMANTDLWGDLRATSLLNIWQNSPAFKNHRAKILNSKCRGCKHYHICNGGCVFMPEINQCKNNYSDL